MTRVKWSNPPGRALDCQGPPERRLFAPRRRRAVARLRLGIWRRRAGPAAAPRAPVPKKEVSLALCSERVCVCEGRSGGVYPRWPVPGAGPAQGLAVQRRSVTGPKSESSGSSVLERNRHDPVSTVAFEFQAHHPFHIFKPVQEFGPGATGQAFQKLWLNSRCTFSRLGQDLDRGSEERGSQIQA